MSKTFTLVLDKTNYLTIRALFKVVGRDATRSELSRVLYDSRRRVFVATDGHIMRWQGLEGEWFKDGIEPDFNFVLEGKDFLTTAAQWKAAGEFVREVTGKACFMGRQYEAGSSEFDACYPEWAAAIAPVGVVGHMATGLDPALIERFAASFLERPKMLVFVPGAKAESGVHIWARGHYVGIIMPLRVMDAYAPDLGQVAALRDALPAVHAEQEEFSAGYAAE